MTARREVSTMSSNQHAPKITSANSLCKATGHDWMTTAAATWRVCKREGCRASESLKDGVWVSNAARYRRHVPVETDGTRPYLQRHGLWPTDSGSDGRRHL